MIILDKRNLLNSTTLPPGAATYAELVDNQIAKYTLAGDGAEQKIAPIEKSADFTHSGKVAAKKAVGLAALNDIDAVHANLQKKLDLDMQAANESAVRYPSISKLAGELGISDTALEIRMANIRDRLEKMPQVERAAALKGASAKGDALTITAAATAPATWPLFPPHELDAARAGYIALKSPEAGERIAAIQAAKSTVRINHASMRRHIGQMTGVALTEDDLLSRASTGKGAAELNATQ